MELSNSKVARILKNVAAAYDLKGDKHTFQSRAYENAADSIEHSTAQVQDLWQEGKLDDIPGIGESMQEHLNELFKTGKVKHFQDIKKGIPEVVFDMLEISGVGPKTAQELTSLGVKSLDDLENKLKSGVLVKKGFSKKQADNILNGLGDLQKRGDRILLPIAQAQADKIVAYLKKDKAVKDAHPLGSLRRMVATVGDLDFSACSDQPQKVVEHFCKMPEVSRVIDKGEAKASVILNSGFQADLLVGSPESYGALLQHFTGSKAHNIHLRTLAERKGLSLSEYGVRKISNKKQVISNKLIKTETEEEFYKLLGMEVPPPEIREDTGEIEAALQGKPGGLPDLVTLKDIKGDLHIHSNFKLEPSHGPGETSIEEIVKKAKQLGYEYVGIADHPPAFTTHSKAEIVKLIEKRTKFIQQLQENTKSIRVLNSLEIDILGDGSLSVPDEALKTLDYCIAGIHSGHRGDKEKITKRLLKAMENPYVDIISHPSGRLLNERQSSDADWEEVFKFAAKHKKILEIDGFPNRLDLRDDLVRQALKYGVKFVVDTDAHTLEGMDNMKFGVSVARRGWAGRENIVNSFDWTKFKKWFSI